MNVLIDTHALLWADLSTDRIPESIGKLLLDRDTKTFFSMASAWEIAIKYNLGKLSLKNNLEGFLDRYANSKRVTILNISIAHVQNTANLPLHHRDPFDRLIISQSIVERMPIISADTKFDEYPIERLWEG